MTKVKRCGNCYYYVKWSNNNHKNSGLCKYWDCRTDAGGKFCESYKSLKYKRMKGVLNEKEESIYQFRLSSFN